MTVETKLFAPEYERNEQGWILFPRDVSKRRSYLNEDLISRVSLHPAKMQVFLTEEIIKYVSEPGETILDPFGGTGTTMICTTMGRPAIILELEDEFYSIIQDTYNHWVATDRNPASALILQGDNRQLLPLPCDHIITSPPYASTLLTTIGNSKIAQDNAAQITTYAKSALNIGRLNPFIYAQQMDKLYDKMVESVRRGGTITIVIKDQMQKEKRIMHSVPCIKSMTSRGMVVKDWFKWKAPGTAFQAIQRKKGNSIVEDEDIIIFTKS